MEPAALEEDGVWIEDTVADIEQDGRIIVGLDNSSPQGVTLRRRTYLAKATSVSGKRVNALTVREWLEDTVSCNRVLVTTRGEEIYEARTWSH